MSNSDQQCTGSLSSDCLSQRGSPQLVRIKAQEKAIGKDLVIRRALPSRQQRMIGAWCFLDHAGPADVSKGEGLRVGPHPHIGLQTFTWMIAGEVLHRDSLGYEQLVRPGQVNLMTAGRGIAHSEESPPTRPSSLHAAQLWIALPNEHRHIEPAFDHYPDLPIVAQDGFTITLLAGEAMGHTAPARIYSPLVGLDFTSDAAAATKFILRPDFEYGVMVMEGEAEIEGELLQPGSLLYLGTGRSSLQLAAKSAVKLILLGGEPFKEDVVLWWNFVARNRQEISDATDAWNAQQGFGEPVKFDGQWLVAPEVPLSFKAAR
jgi:redox-sensitive bicupin YhaK (pirin superfamily)